MVRKNTLVLFSVFLVLLIGFFLLQKYQADNPTLTLGSDATETPLPTYLFDLTPEKLSDIKIEGADGQMVELQKDVDGTWLLLQPPTLSIGTDQTAISTALSQVGTVRVLSELESSPPLDVVGLDDPSATIVFSLVSGNPLTVEVGDAAPTGNGYYIRVNGDPPKLVDKYLFDKLTAFLTTPPLLATPVLSSTIGITPTLDLSTPLP